MRERESERERERTVKTGSVLEENKIKKKKRRETEIRSTLYAERRPMTRFTK